MMDNDGMVAAASRFTPPTPRSRRLGRELRKLREARRLNSDAVAKEVRCSPSRISRIESGEIRPRAGDVMELLHVYGVAIDDEPGRSLLDLARNLRQPGWWQRLDALSNRYATLIAYEEEAKELRNFEPTLMPGLLQTEDYAHAVNVVGRETDTTAIEQRVRARMTRQDVLQRESGPLKLCAVIAEAALSAEVGGREILRNQLLHIVTVAKQPNITVQVLRYAAGAHLATGGPFQILTFAGNEPPLGYIETLAGELFLESARDIEKLTTVFNHLRTLAMSPAESIKFLQERARQ